jgi:hypothetical protein
MTFFFMFSFGPALPMLHHVTFGMSITCFTTWGAVEHPGNDRPLMCMLDRYWWYTALVLLTLRLRSLILVTGKNWFEFWMYSWVRARTCIYISAFCWRSAMCLIVQIHVLCQYLCNIWCKILCRAVFCIICFTPILTDLCVWFSSRQWFFFIPPLYQHVCVWMVG